MANVPSRHEWILIVDADEWIVPELAEEIRAAVLSTELAGYYINRRFMFMGRWIKHSGYYPSWNLRLLKCGCGEYERLSDVGDTSSGDNEVHEHIQVNGPVGHLKSDMLHFAFPTIAIWVEKHNRYTNWEAIVQLKGTHASSHETLNKTLARRRWLKGLSKRLPFRPTLRFLYSYIFRRGFMDGRPGYVLCRLQAIYEFLSVVKYEEMRKFTTGFTTEARRHGGGEGVG